MLAWTEEGSLALLPARLVPALPPPPPGCSVLEEALWLLGEPMPIKEST